MSPCNEMLSIPNTKGIIDDFKAAHRLTNSDNTFIVNKCFPGQRKIGEFLYSNRPRFHTNEEN